MPQLLKTSIVLTIFIILPMMFANTVLSYLQRSDYRLEWLLLIVIGVVLTATIRYFLKVNPLIEKRKVSHRSRTDMA